MSGLSEYLEVLQNHLSTWGYVPVDTPMLEETELYLKKSGSEVITRLYSLTDPGGRQLSLRPEFTASVIKNYIGERSIDPLPIRCQYSGPVFRYGSRYGPFGQSHQVGAELIGASSPLADAEVIAAAGKGLELLGLEDYEVIIGHAGLLPGLLDELRLSQRSKNLILGNIQALKDGQEGTDKLKALLSHSPNGGLGNGDQTLNYSPDEATIAVFRKLLGGSGGQYTGSRSAEEIISRFSEKLTAERYEDLDRAISVVTDLANVQGDRASAIKTARSIINRYGLSNNSLDSLENILETLEKSHGITSVKIDLGLLRGLAYYTGPIFEIRLHKGPNSEALCGGGRYDGLVRALGGEDIPALGFAYYLESLRRAMESIAGSAQDGLPAHDLILVVPASKDFYYAAVTEAQRRRQNNQNVRVELAQRPLEESLKYAASADIDRVVVVGAVGVESEYLMTANGWSPVVRFSN